MRTISTFILMMGLTFALNILMAQSTNSLALNDLIPGGKSYSNYTIKHPENLSWWANKAVYSLENTILEVDLSNKKENKVLTDLKTINNILTKSGKAEVKELSNISFPYQAKSILVISDKNRYVHFDFISNKIISMFNLPEEAQNVEFNPLNETYTYTIENNLFITNSQNKDFKVTNDRDLGIVNGQAVHRNEFGINKGIFWSPDGEKLAYYRMDETMVTDYPLVDISGRIAKVKNVKYPMAGTKSHEVTIGIFSPKTGETIFLETGLPEEKYFTNIAWSTDSKFIYIAELNRGQDTLQLKRYNAETGKLDSILFTETHTKYVEPENPIQFLPRNTDKFIWQSKKDGYNHLYLYNVNGKLEKQLTKGEWNIISILGFDLLGENLFYISNEGSPIENHIYKLNLKTNKRIKLSNSEGVHKATISSNGKFVLDKFSSINNPLTIDIIDTEKRKTTNIHQAENPYKDAKMPEIRISSIKANDGKTDLYYRITQPADIDSTKQHPVIVYVYGGPHSQLVDNSWLGQARGWDIYMANKGYIVFTLDNRGTNNRGTDF